jgi:hypothetical protein
VVSFAMLFVGRPDYMEDRKPVSTFVSSQAKLRTKS